MRFFLAALVLPALCAAAILPDAIGPYHVANRSTPTVTDRPIWDEYGLKATETAGYTNGADHFTATAYRLQDSTGAMAAFQWQRPAASHRSPAGSLAAETGDSLIYVDGNYLVRFDGYKPSSVELDAVGRSLLNVDSTALPVLSNYLPAADLVPNSERYIIGPAGLQAFAPAIPPSVAAFHYSAEGQVGVFHSPKGDTRLAIFSYPTAQIAMQRTPEFEKLGGVVVKRTGPLVAVVLAPPDPDFAERLLAGIRYQAEVTRDEYVPTRRDNVGEMLVNIFVLIGILLAFSIVLGLALGGFRTLRSRGKAGAEAEPMITLHLEQR
jgi:hypothetical protein